MNWRGVRVCITGGASFISSHLVDALVKQYASVRVIDNLSSGKKEYLAEHMKTGAISFIEGDLNDSRMTREAILGRDVVFHLAADHGGRGYVDRHQADCATNLGLDGIVFKACLDAKVKQVVFASSGCIYPVHLQTNLKEELLLTETMAGPPYNPDKMYGLAKMAGELTLKAFYEDYGLKSASCRFFTVYGPRGKEDHAIMAMIARAFIRQDPFVIWGDGCLPEGGTIISNPGIAPIASVKAGDRVLSSDGNYTQVLAPMSKWYSGDMISIRATGVPVARFTSNHPVWVGKPPFYGTRYCRDASKLVFEWVPAGRIRRGDFVAIPRIKKSFDQVIDLSPHVRNRSRSNVPSTIPLTEDLAYMLGWYTAEGNTTIEKNRTSITRRVAFTLGPNEGDIASRLSQIIRTLGPHPWISKEGRGIGVKFCSAHIAEWMDKHVGVGAENKKVPLVITEAPENIVLAYLDGLFSGDGSAVKNGRALCSVSSSLLYGCQLLIAKIGGWSSLSWVTDKPRIHSYKKKGRETISVGKLEWRPRATHHRHHATDNWMLTPVREVSSLPFEGRVYNVETESNTYCAPFVVHNSQVRNWTMVHDIVSGLLLSAEHIHDAAAVNLGTTERITVLQAAKMACACFGHQPEFQFLPKMPVGPLNRVSDNTRAFERMGWKPTVPFATGIVDTAEWYAETHERAEVEKTLESRLLAR